ncbi:TPA: HNH endonuclease [Bacillus mycoides]|nr:HNH endonuclease [Bacillus mycoides]
MELVPFGIHNITKHNGGRTKGQKDKRTKGQKDIGQTLHDIK